MIHRGEFLSYYEVYYKDTQTGEVKTYEMVSKTGSTHFNTEELKLDTIGKQTNAIVLLVFNETRDKMLLLREFRLGVNDWVINNVAGLIDAGETPEQAAARELMEETGIALTRVTSILKPSFSCAPIAGDLTTLLVCQADGTVNGSNEGFEITEPFWVDKIESKNILDGNECISARTQAFIYSWVNGL